MSKSIDINGKVYDIREDKAGRGFLRLMTAPKVETMTIGEAIDQFGLQVETWMSKSGKPMVRIFWRSGSCTEFAGTVERIRDIVKPVSCM